MRTKFDRLELQLPLSSILYLNQNHFSVTQRGGVNLCYSFKQTTPYYYRLTMYPYKEMAYLEFTGKSLLEAYPDLIDEDSIYTCLRNINQDKVFIVDIKQVLDEGIVTKCDVTVDLPCQSSIKELYRSLSLNNYKKYIITDFRDSQFAIKTTGANRRTQSRLVIYHKGEEFETNKDFIYSISNASEQRDYFSDKIRAELNLESKDRIRFYFEIDGETKLKDVLESTADPIGKFLQMSVLETEEISILKEYSHEMKDILKIMLLCLCNWDESKVERVIRDISHPRSNIKKALKPYLILKDKIQHNIVSPEEDINFIQIREALKYMIKQTLPYKTSIEETLNLMELYKRAGYTDSNDN